MNIQVRPPIAAARFVTIAAWTERKLAASSLPPLKPNQPNQTRQVPRMMCETE